MWRLSGFEGSQTLALWWPAVFTYTDTLVEGPLHGLCDWITVVFWLERRQLWLDSRNCQLVDQDGALQASQSHHWRSGTSKSHPRRGSLTLQPTKLNHDWQRLVFYLKILVITLLLPWHQTKALNRVPSLDKRSNQTAKKYHKSPPSSLCQLWTKWLGQTSTDGGVCLQQCQKC